MTTNPLCPYGSRQPLAECCAPYMKNLSSPTAENLMRSRYTAHCMQNVDYLIATTWPRQHDALKQSGLYQTPDKTRWLRLEVIRSEGGKARNTTGIVEFKAWFKNSDGTESAHHEVSDFVKENNTWYFVYPNLSAKIPERNAPCLAAAKNTKGAASVTTGRDSLAPAPYQ